MLEADEAAGAEGREAYDEELMSDGLVALLDSIFLDSVPIARRLMDQLEARGWHGWTKTVRITP